MNSRARFSSSDAQQHLHIEQPYKYTHPIKNETPDSKQKISKETPGGGGGSKYSPMSGATSKERCPIGMPSKRISVSALDVHPNENRRGDE